MQLEDRIMKKDTGPSGIHFFTPESLIQNSFRVEAPVARRSPHRPVREDFPHTVPW